MLTPGLQTRLETLQRPYTFTCSLAIHEMGSTYRSGMGSMACPSSHAGASMPTLQLFDKDDGILIVDHGSRRAQSNAMIHSFVNLFKQKTGHSNVEPAHMELASPTIKDAFNKCISQGATRVVIAPYFLSPGRHWDKDIPALAAEAAKEHENVSYIVTSPIGLHDLLVDILQDRINHCLSHVAGKMPECDMCMGTGRCKVIHSLALSEDGVQQTKDV